MSTQSHAIAHPVRSSGWFIRRALIGLFILTISIAGSAALLYASIDQSQDQAQRAAEVELAE